MTLDDYTKDMFKFFNAKRVESWRIPNLIQKSYKWLDYNSTLYIEADQMNTVFNNYCESDSDYIQWQYQKRAYDLCRQPIVLDEWELIYKCISRTLFFIPKEIYCKQYKTTSMHSVDLLHQKSSSRSILYIDELFVEFLSNNQYWFLYTNDDAHMIDCVQFSNNLSVYRQTIESMYYKCKAIIRCDELFKIIMDGVHKIYWSVDWSRSHKTRNVPSILCNAGAIISNTNQDIVNQLKKTWCIESDALHMTKTDQLVYCTSFVACTVLNNFLHSIDGNDKCGNIGISFCGLFDAVCYKLSNDLINNFTILSQEITLLQELAYKGATDASILYCKRYNLAPRQCIDNCLKFDFQKIKPSTNWNYQRKHLSKKTNCKVMTLLGSQVIAQMFNIFPSVLIPTVVLNQKQYYYTKGLKHLQRLGITYNLAYSVSNQLKLYHSIIPFIDNYVETIIYVRDFEEIKHYFYSNLIKERPFTYVYLKKICEMNCINKK